MKRQRTSSAVNRPYKKPRSTSTKAMVVAPPRYMPLGKPANLYAGRSKEIKAVDVNITQTMNIPGSVTFQLLNGIQTGAAFYNRVGARVEGKSLHIRGYIRNIATGIDDVGRVLVVYDRQPNGAFPNITDVIQARDQTGATSNSGVSPVNLDQRDRITILRDYQVYLPSVTNTAGVLTNGPAHQCNGNPLEFSLFIKLKGLITHFKSSSAPTTIADMNTGAIYLVCLCFNDDGKWRLQCTSRYRFNDL